METNMQATRCAIYIRVSTSEQAIHGKSLGAQRDFLLSYAEEHQLHVVGIFADEGKTARKNLKNRRAVKNLLELVKRDQVDVILFWKMDRWFRSVSDFYKVQDILDKHHVRWIAAAEPNMNLDTRDGRLNLNIYLSIGQNEVDTTSERIRFTAAGIVKNGGLIFGDAAMPLGYRAGVRDGKKAMVFDEAARDMVRDAFDHLLLYQSKSRTASYLSDKYGCRFTYSMLSNMCKSEFYVGRYRENDNYCPPYLTEEEFQKIQQIVRQNIRRPHTGRVYLFSRLILCPFCGSPFSGYCGSPHLCAKTNEITANHYYRCYRTRTSDKPHDFHIQISEKALERRLLDLISSDARRAEIRCRKISEPSPAGKKTNPQKILESLKRLSDIYVDGSISREDYELRRGKLQTRYEELTAPSSEPAKDFSWLKKTLEQKRDGGVDLESLYRLLDEPRRQAFWRNILEKVEIGLDRQVKNVFFLPNVSR